MYTVIIGHNVVKDGEEIDHHLEEYEFDTYTEALAEAEKHHIGDIEGEYGDGAEAIVDSVEIEED